MTVELKNNVSIEGVLVSVDQFLNVKLDDVKTDSVHLQALKNCFLRGSVIRYIQLNPKDIDFPLLQEATIKKS